MTAQTLDHTDVLEAKIDALTEQIGVLTREAEARTRSREARDELGSDLMFVANDAMAAVTRELESLQRDVELTDLLRLLRRLAVAAPTLERSLDLLDSVAELGADAVPLATDVMNTATRRLGEMQERGYFGFAAAGLQIVDRVVTEYTEEDVAALGDNVVTILDTVKEITQPEMLALLHRMIDALQRQQHVFETESEEPPSMWTLFKKMREPDVRRGMGRALSTLGAVSAETGPESMSPTATTSANTTTTTTSKGDA
jgi:uncharacterized protein YjgD (DUF1641 family)